MVLTAQGDPAELSTDIPALSSRELDTYLAAQLLSPDELKNVTARELVILRANLRSAILTSPDIKSALRNRVREVLGELRGSAAPTTPGKKG